MLREAVKRLGISYECAEELKGLPGSVNDGRVDELLQLAPDRIRRGGQQLGEKQHRQLLDGIDPEQRAGGTAPSVLAHAAGDLHRGGVRNDREAETETKPGLVLLPDRVAELDQ